MNIFNELNIDLLRPVFPELTHAQFETAVLFSLGIPQKKIALLRSVSYQAVNQSLNDIKSKLQCSTSGMLLAVFQVRIAIFLAQNIINRSNSG